MQNLNLTNVQNISLLISQETFLEIEEKHSESTDSNAITGLDLSKLNQTDDTELIRKYLQSLGTPLEGSLQDTIGYLATAGSDYRVYTQTIKCYEGQLVLELGKNHYPITFSDKGVFVNDCWEVSLNSEKGEITLDGVKTNVETPLFYFMFEGNTDEVFGSTDVELDFKAKFKFSEIQALAGISESKLRKAFKDKNFDTFIKVLGGFDVIKAAKVGQSNGEKSDIKNITDVMSDSNVDYFSFDAVAVLEKVIILKQKGTSYWGTDELKMIFCETPTGDKNVEGLIVATKKVAASGNAYPIVHGIVLGKKTAYLNSRSKEDLDGLDDVGGTYKVKRYFSVTRKTPNSSWIESYVLLEGDLLLRANDLIESGFVAALKGVPGSEIAGLRNCVSHDVKGYDVSINVSADGKRMFFNDASKLLNPSKTKAALSPATEPTPHRELVASLVTDNDSDVDDIPF